MTPVVLKFLPNHDTCVKNEGGFYFLAYDGKKPLTYVNFTSFWSETPFEAKLALGVTHGLSCLCAYEKSGYLVHSGLFKFLVQGNLSFFKDKNLLFTNHEMCSLSLKRHFVNQLLVLCLLFNEACQTNYVELY